MQNLNQGGFSNTQSTQNPPSTSIPSGLPQPQQLSLHPYSQPTLPLGPFASLVGYPYLPQNYYVPPAAFQQAYSSNGPFHQSGGAAVPGSAMKYSMPQYKSGLPVTSPPQHSSAVSGYGGFGSSSNIPNFGQNQSASPATTMGIDEALSSQLKEANHYMALQQVQGATFFRLASEILDYFFCTTEDLLISFWGVHLWLFSERQLSDVASWSCWFKSCFSCSTW